MNSPEAFSRMMNFHLWRQSQVEDLLANAGEEKANQETGFSFGTLKKAVWHLAWAEALWLTRVKPTFQGNLKKESSAHELMKEWKTISTSWQSHITGFSVADWKSSIRYSNTEGKSFSNTMDEIFTHLIDHATYHTGQIMAMARFLEIEPIPTNYIHFFRNTGN